LEWTHYSELDNLCYSFSTRQWGPLNAGGPLCIEQPAQSIAASLAVVNSCPYLCVFRQKAAMSDKTVHLTESYSLLE